MQVALRVLAMVIAAHGLIFAAAVTLVSGEHASDGPPWLVDLYFVGLLIPALILAAPLNRLLWWLGLMEAPGWFAWPRPLGFALVYACWVLALVAASYLARAIAARRRTRALK